MAAALLSRNSHRLTFGRHIKLFSDGAFFSQLAQLQEPGYIDGHHGEWLAAPEELERHIRAYWQAGYQIHVHVTGDLGLELTLDSLQKMQDEKPASTTALPSSTLASARRSKFVVLKRWARKYCQRLTCMSYPTVTPRRASALSGLAKWPDWAAVLPQALTPRFTQTSPWRRRSRLTACGLR